MLAIKTIHSSLIYMYKEEVKKATSLTNKQSPWQRNTGTICLCAFINADICVFILQVQGWLSSLFIQRTNNFWSSDIFKQYIFENTLYFHYNLLSYFSVFYIVTCIYLLNLFYLFYLLQYTVITGPTCDRFRTLCGYKVMVLTKKSRWKPLIFSDNFNMIDWKTSSTTSRCST